MALLHVDFHSESLKGATSMYVILPEKYQGIGATKDVAKRMDPRDPTKPDKRIRTDVWDGEKPLKVLYLLHGASDNYTIWNRRTSIERYIAGKEIAVVMPSADMSYYCNEKYGKAYWDFISEELPMIVKSFFKISDKREDTFAAGLSMGGYGALKLGLSNPERFNKVASLSGAVDLAGLFAENAVDNKDSVRVFGEASNIKGSNNDLYYLASKNKNNLEKLDIYISCGTEDFLYDANKKFINHLKDNNYDVTDSDIPEMYHEWALWDDEIQKVIEWLDI